MQKILKAAIIMYSSLLLSVGSALPADECSLLYRDINRETVQGILSTDKREEIARIFKQSNLNEHQKAEKAFHITVEERLRFLQPHEAEEARHILANGVYREYYKIHVPEQDELRAIAEYPEIQLKLPQAIEKSVLEYGILMHELEHIIQKVRIKSMRGVNRGFGFGIPDREAQQVQAEVGAMISEYEYLKAVPKEVRDALRRKLRSMPHIGDPIERDLFDRLLRVDSANAALHVRNEHLNDRYPKPERKEPPKAPDSTNAFSRIPPISKAWAGATLVGTASGLYFIRRVCGTELDLRQKQKSSQFSSFFLHFCSTR